MERLKFIILCACLIAMSSIRSLEVALLVLAFLVLLSFIMKDTASLKVSALLVLPYAGLYLLISYLIMDSKDTSPLNTAARSLDITLFSLLFFKRLNFYRVFSFSKGLTFFFVSFQVHVRNLTALRKELGEAFESRAFKSMSLSERIARTGVWLNVLAERVLRKSEEVKYAFRSRGLGV